MVLQTSAIRFRKWSNKGYAIFSSLGRCVTIGHLSKEIADSSLSKQQRGCNNSLFYSWYNSLTENIEKIHPPEVNEDDVQIDTILSTIYVLLAKSVTIYCATEIPENLCHTNVLPLKVRLLSHSHKRFLINGLLLYYNKQ